MKSGYKVDFDWRIGEELFNVAVSGMPDEWFIEGIERYVDNSNRTEVVAGEKVEELEKVLNRDTEFSMNVEELLINERVDNIEALRDEEIERKIDDYLMDKAWEKIHGKSK